LNERAEAPDREDEKLIQDVAMEHRHELKFSTWRSPLSRRARVTQLILAANLVAFAAEVNLGGSTKIEVLYQMGAMSTSAVMEGEWWRLVAPMFLHFGPVHLAANMFALCLLGPYCEYALGPLRYLLTYLAAGIGSFATLMAVSLALENPQFAVGASGSIMGLAGAIAALTLRGWKREGALPARRRLFGVLAIVAMQTVFDWMTPEVSMTAHLSGAAIGFTVVAFLGERNSLPADR
jgi:rhomboid protease GluP